jgi:hypothetical protein
MPELRNSRQNPTIRENKKSRPAKIPQQDSPGQLVPGLVMLVVPVLFGLPAMFFAIPPLVVLFIATLAFSIQIAAPILGLAAVFAIIMDCFVESCLCLFDGMLAMRPIIGTGLGCRGYEH